MCARSYSLGKGQRPSVDTKYKEDPDPPKSSWEPHSNIKQLWYILHEHANTKANRWNAPNYTVM